MNLKMNYSSFIKLKDFFELLDIGAEIKDYKTTNDILEGNLEIRGKYLKKDAITDAFFSEIIPFTVVFNDSDYEIMDIACVNLDTVNIEGRGVDVTFDIDVTYDNYQMIPVNLPENTEDMFLMEMSDEMRVEEEPQDGEDKAEDKIENENISLETESLSAVEFERLKEEETERLDSLLKSTLNYKDDNYPTEEVVIRGIKEKKDKVRVCYYQNDTELEKLSEKYNISLNTLFKENQSGNINQYRRVIIHESGRSHSK
ncbi:MAG: hypothetical protein NC182_00770 [Prevotella sp.]|nr:hypothetical protein [Staphylococcus sp.]MCM1349717.1 hypothetical protein [Prevotella sp.]